MEESDRGPLYSDDQEAVSGPKRSVAFVFNETDEELLTLLEEERDKFGKADKEYMQALVDELVKRSVYKRTKTMKEYNYSFMSMVESWGARWHEWRKPHYCPNCGIDLRSDNGPPFKREIGVYSIERDRTEKYRCPDCKIEWDRFTGKVINNGK